MQMPCLDRKSQGNLLASILAAATRMQTKVAILEIQLAQQNDEVTLRLSEALKTSGQCPKGHLWRRYAKLWSQFVIVDGVICRKYAPGPTTEMVMVPILPKSLQQRDLLQCPGAGHQGYKKMP